jgi:hypothetical protein
MHIVVTRALLDDEAAEISEATGDNRLQIVQNIFEHLEEEGQAELLSGYCTGERETYNDDAYVTDIYFDDGCDTSGLIDVSFTGSSYFGCKDMDGLYERDESIEFNIDLDALRIEFVTNPPDVEVRTPDEEF